VNKLYDLLKNLPEKLEHLTLWFDGCKTLTNNGFYGITKAIENLTTSEFI
jgi:hypothetical protein